MHTYHVRNALYIFQHFRFHRCTYANVFQMNLVVPFHRPPRLMGASHMQKSRNIVAKKMGIGFFHALSHMDAICARFFSCYALVASERVQWTAPNTWNIHNSCFISLEMAIRMKRSTVFPIVVAVASFGCSLRFVGFSSRASSVVCPFPARIVHSAIAAVVMSHLVSEWNWGDEKMFIVNGSEAHHDLLYAQRGWLLALTFRTIWGSTACRNHIKSAKIEIFTLPSLPHGFFFSRALVLLSIVCLVCCSFWLLLLSRFQLN